MTAGYVRREEQPGDGTSDCWRSHSAAPSRHASHATDLSRESQAALVSDREHFRYTFTSALTTGLLSPFDWQPLHAAALVRGETTLLLAGPSGTGRSTLWYSGALNGLFILPVTAREPAR